MVLHPAGTRGHADHGWLQSFHTFSFAGYHDPQRMHFGVLRVLNDDTVAPGRGFGRHPHSNMEIVSIPLSGELVHQDSMGNKAIIREGDIQVMSAGTGVEHSEFNNRNDAAVKFLQIWIFPRENGVKPRYDQQRIAQRKNEWVQILSPSAEDEGVWIHQDTWFSMGLFEPGAALDYTPRRAGNGLYTFVLDGSFSGNGQTLGLRDGMGVSDTSKITFQSPDGGRLLLMDVPMN